MASTPIRCRIPTLGTAIAEEARRIGAWFLVGSDRPLSETQWENVNIVFNPEGEIVGEYQKQHPVPFGEYIPFRPLFDWIPELDQVPRDMIPARARWCSTPVCCGSAR